MIEITDEEAVKLHAQIREAAEFLDELVYNTETTDLLYIGANIGKALVKLESLKAGLEHKIVTAKRTEIGIIVSPDGNTLTTVYEESHEPKNPSNL